MQHFIHNQSDFKGAKILYKLSIKNQRGFKGLKVKTDSQNRIGSDVSKIYGSVVTKQLNSVIRNGQTFPAGFGSFGYGLT